MMLDNRATAAGLLREGKSATWCAVRQWVTQQGKAAVTFSTAPNEPPVMKRKKAFQQEKEADSVRVRKIRLLATADQRAWLKRWVGAGRWVYNHVVAEFKRLSAELKRMREAGEDDPKAVATVTSGFALNSLRAKFAAKSAFKKDNKWMLDVPYDVRDGALLDAVRARKECLKKAKADPTFRFQLKYRSKKAPSESIYVCSRAFSRGTMYPKFELGELRWAEKLPPVIAHDCRLQRTALGHYYICLPMDRPEPVAPPPLLPGENQARQGRVVALDPGVRTFLTGYDPSGRLVDIAPGSVARLVHLCVHLDRLQSQVDTAPNGRKRRRLRKAATRLRARIRNVVDDLHKKAACYLALEYDLVLLPEFESSQMVRRAGRRIRSKTARSMLTWAHYRFRQTLLARARLSGCVVKLVTEEYTSKTCGRCGKIHDKLGGQKTFRCPSCGHEVDRDANGARNIALMNAADVDLLVEPPSHPRLGVALPPGALLGAI